MIVCTKCNNLIDRSNIFCPSCGTKLIAKNGNLTSGNSLTNNLNLTFENSPTNEPDPTYESYSNTEPETPKTMPIKFIAWSTVVLVCISLATYFVFDYLKKNESVQSSGQSSKINANVQAIEKSRTKESTANASTNVVEISKTKLNKAKDAYNSENYASAMKTLYEIDKEFDNTPDPETIKDFRTIIFTDLLKKTGAKATSPDKEGNTQWIIPKKMNPAVVDFNSDGTAFYPEIYDRVETAFLFFRFGTSGKSAIQFNSLQFNMDGKTIALKIDQDRVQSDFHDNGYVYEYILLGQGQYSDQNFDLAKTLTSITNSAKTIVRFQGSNGYRDYHVTEADKAMIRNFLYLNNAYYANYNAEDSNEKATDGHFIRSEVMETYPFETFGPNTSSENTKAIGI